MTVRQKRFVGGFFVAVLLSLGVGVIAAPAKWNPLCANYTVDDPMYWLLGCWIDPPEPDKDAKGG